MKQEYRSLRRNWAMWACAIGALMPYLGVEATSVTWTGGSGNWSEPAKWSGLQVPGDGDDVVIPASVSVALTNATAQLGSLELSGTLTFSKWTTALNATNVVVKGGATVTHTLCNTNAALDNLNRVWIVCSNLTVEAGGIINANAVGYKGGIHNSIVNGQGPGGGINGPQSGAGGSYGGEGGMANFSGTTYGRPPYGSAEEAVDPGSGGGCKSSGTQLGDGGHGGGAVRILAGGTVAVHGTITANGEDGGSGRGAGGSGGGIYVACRDITGTGAISANGGNAYSISGGGGGGRIALHYTNAIASGVDVLCTAGRGLSPDATHGHDGDIGTLWFTDASFLNLTRIRHTGQLLSPAITGSWAVPALTVSNGWVRFTQSNLQLTVTNDITITGTKGILQMQGGATLRGGGDLRLTDGGSLQVFATGANSGASGYGALVAVTGGLYVSSGSWVYPFSDSINGGSPRFEVGSLLIETNAGFNADRKGYIGKNRSPGYGPGAGLRGKGLGEGSGGGYGGAGGNGWNTTGSGSILPGGSPYGSLHAPIAPGSAGGAEVDNPTTGIGTYATGGGSIRIDVLGDAILNGVLTADAGETVYGGGSGGGIFVRCTGAFSGGPNAVLSAAGGKSTYATPTCGGGGGGRIAVWRNTPRSAWSRLEQGLLRHEVVSTSHAVYGGATDVAGGTGTYANGGSGSIVFLVTPPPAGTVINIR